MTLVLSNFKTPNTTVQTVRMNVKDPYRLADATDAGDAIGASVCRLPGVGRMLER